MAYTTIDDPSAHFHTLTYAGNGSNPRSLTNSANAGDFKPDWLWIKNRTNTYDHAVFDSLRGVDKLLKTNQTNAEGSNSGYHNSFDTNGFTVTANGNVNNNNENYVAWQWKANGGTTSNQTGSDIDSVTQVNTTSKFSIITYTGASNADSDSDNNSGAYWRVKHGLGSTPKLAIFKKRSSAAAWYVWHHKIGGTLDYKYIQLQTNKGVDTESAVLFGNTDWSSTEFEIGGWDVVNRDGSTYVAYMFDEVQGYSKFGSYTGNGNNNGPFVYTGFKPAFVLIKRAVDGGSSQWHTFDSTRNEFNVANKVLFPSTNDNESSYTGSDPQIDILSNGFKLRSSYNQVNASSGNYIHICFAEHPFVSSKGAPVTAR